MGTATHLKLNKLTSKHFTAFSVYRRGGEDPHMDVFLTTNTRSRLNLLFNEDSYTKQDKSYTAGEKNALLLGKIINAVLLILIVGGFVLADNYEDSITRFFIMFALSFLFFNAFAKGYRKHGTWKRPEIFNVDSFAFMKFGKVPDSEKLEAVYSVINEELITDDSVLFPMGSFKGFFSDEDMTDIPDGLPQINELWNSYIDLFLISKVPRNVVKNMEELIAHTVRNESTIRKWDLLRAEEDPSDASFEQMKIYSERAIQSEEQVKLSLMNVAYATEQFIATHGKEN